MRLGPKFAFVTRSEIAGAYHLQEALFACYEDNWGVAQSELDKALEHRTHGFDWRTRDDWMRASAVLLHLDYGSRFLAFLDDRGDTIARLWPWVEALRANVAGSERYLQGVAAEVRPVAGELFEETERRLRILPESTRRWSPPKSKVRKPRRRR